MFVGCSLFNPSVHYVLPNGYTGVFTIVLDEASGVDVERKGWTYVYEIPLNGVLKVRSLSPLQQMHSETAAYQDGTGIPVYNSTVKPDVIALRHGRGSGSRRIGDKNVGPTILTYVIGTQEQLNSVEYPVNTNSTLKP